MKNKTILIIAISAVAAIIAVVVFVLLISKQPASQSGTTPPSGSTGSGGVSTGASPDLVVVGSGTVAVLTPKTDPTEPYSTSAPRVESPITNNNGSSTALQPATTTSTQPAASSGEIAYNHNQSDNSFLTQYYPDAQQVISGNDGPAGNIGQDPANQVLYTTGPATPTGPTLSLPNGVSTSGLQTSSNNSSSAIVTYLQALSATTAPFDIVNNTNLVTDPLQNLDANAALVDGQQATSVLKSIQALTVPSSVADLQASYVDAYQQYITYAGQLASLLNNGASAIASEEGALESTAQNVSTVLTFASADYNNTATYYGYTPPSASNQ